MTTFNDVFDKDKKKKCIICDIDGTIAHMTNRTAFEYHKVGDDEIDNVVLHCVYSLALKYDADIIFLTGRNADCYIETYNWIWENVFNTMIPFEYKKMVGTHNKVNYYLYSRGMNDFRKDIVIKKELYEKVVKKCYDEVIAVFDDRPCVVNQWHDMGLKVFSMGDQRIDF